MFKLKWLMAMATLAACLVPLGSAYADDDIPHGTNVILFLDDRNNIIQGVDATGADLEECQLCSTAMEDDYGPGCEDLYINPDLDPEVNLCRGAAGTTLGAGSIETLITRVNPVCYLFYQRIAGKALVYQYCKP